MWLPSLSFEISQQDEIVLRLVDLLKQNEQKRLIVSILRILYGNDRNVRHIRVKNHTLINHIIEETFANKTDIPLLTALRQIIVRYISVQENRDDLN